MKWLPLVDNYLQGRRNLVAPNDQSWRPDRRLYRPLLDHRGLFREFAQRGGRGVILDGAMLGADSLIKSLKTVRDLELQIIATVSYSSLRAGAMSKAGLGLLAKGIEPADAVLVAFQGMPTGLGVETTQQSIEAQEDSRVRHPDPHQHVFLSQRKFTSALTQLTGKCS